MKRGINSRLLLYSVLGVVIALCVFILFKYVLVRPSADVFDSSVCENIDYNIEVVVVDVNKSNPKHTLTAYNENGVVIINAPAVLANATFENIGEESYFTNEESLTGMTPLGVYKMGQAWTNRQDAVDENGNPGTNHNGTFIPYNDGIARKGSFGPFFIDLEGTPVDEGSSLCGLETDSEKNNCRHIGIHSTGDDNLINFTAGCIRSTTDIVEALIDYKHEGKNIIVTDIPLAGYIHPTDEIFHKTSLSDIWIIDEKAGLKKFKGPLNAKVSIVEGKGDEKNPIPPDKIHDFTDTDGHPYWWLAEIAKPIGPYEISVSGADGYHGDETWVRYNRKDGNGQYESKEGSTDTNLALLGMDGNYSYYFGQWCPTGYHGNLLASGWDFFASNSVIEGSEKEGYRVVLPIKDYFPKLGEIGEGISVEDAPVSKFAVYRASIPWNDVGYGSNNHEPWALMSLEEGAENREFEEMTGGGALATFYVNYGNVKDIELDLNTSNLTSSELKDLPRWGVVVKQIAKINHTDNDFIALADEFENYPPSKTDATTMSTAENTDSKSESEDQSEESGNEQGTSATQSTNSEPTTSIPETETSSVFEDEYSEIVSEPEMTFKPVGDDYKWFTEINDWSPDENIFTEEITAFDLQEITELPEYAPTYEEPFLTDFFNLEPDPVVYSDPATNIDYLYKPSPEKEYFNEPLDYISMDPLDFMYDTFVAVIDYSLDYIDDIWNIW